MSSALQFVRTPSGLTILLGFKPYTVASTDPIFPSVLSLIQANSSEADVLAVIELGKSVAQPIAPAVATPSFAVDEQGGDADEPVLVLTGLSVRDATPKSNSPSITNPDYKTPVVIPQYQQVDKVAPQVQQSSNEQMNQLRQSPPSNTTQTTPVSQSNDKLETFKNFKQEK